jgi:hypothetical protein
MEGGVAAKSAIAAEPEIRITAAGMRRCDKKPVRANQRGVFIIFVLYYFLSLAFQSAESIIAPSRCLSWKVHHFQCRGFHHTGVVDCG